MNRFITSYLCLVTYSPLKQFNQSALHHHWHTPVSFILKYIICSFRHWYFVIAVHNPSKYILFCLFSEFTETLPSWQSCIPLLCPDQNEPIKHAVLRERRNASAASWRHDCGWMWVPVIASPSSVTCVTERCNSTNHYWEAKRKKTNKRSNKKKKHLKSEEMGEIALWYLSLCTARLYMIYVQRYDFNLWDLVCKGGHCFFYFLFLKVCWNTNFTTASSLPPGCSWYDQKNNYYQLRQFKHKIAIFCTVFNVRYNLFNCKVMYIFIVNIKQLYLCSFYMCKVIAVFYAYIARA